MTRKQGIYEKYIKRPQDFVLAVLALVILSPVIIAIAILVRIKLGSPVLHIQKRPGFKEKVFNLYKFRTMTDERDNQGELLPDNIRITKFGKFLRTASLDELPELWNIIRGDMAIVGPRPLAQIYLQYYNETEKHRHDVRPGLTGLAQINGRNLIDWEARFAYDLEYISKISFIGDIKIILKTVKKIIIMEGIALRGTGSIEDFHVHRIGQYSNKEQ